MWGDIIERYPVLSDELNSVGYDHQSTILEIEFKNGDLNKYFCVSELLYCELMNTDCKSAFFHEKIENNFTKD